MRCRNPTAQGEPCRCARCSSPRASTPRAAAQKRGQKVRGAGLIVLVQHGGEDIIHSNDTRVLENDRIALAHFAE